MVVTVDNPDFLTLLSPRHTVVPDSNHSVALPSVVRRNCCSMTLGISGAAYDDVGHENINKNTARFSWQHPLMVATRTQKRNDAICHYNIYVMRLVLS